MADIREKVYFSVEFGRSISEKPKIGQVPFVFIWNLRFHLVPECAFGHGTKCRGGFERDFAPVESGRALGKLGRQLSLGPAEADAPCSRRRDSLPLALADVAAFVFRDEREKLQDDFGNDFADEAVASV